MPPGSPLSISGELPGLVPLRTLAVLVNEAGQHDAAELVANKQFLSYVFQLGNSEFTVSVMLTFAALFAVGASRALVTNEHWFKAGLEMLAVGAAAAAVAYGVGAWLANLTE